jgi:hypothetical protein
MCAGSMRSEVQEEALTRLAFKQFGLLRDKNTKASVPI